MEGEISERRACASERKKTRKLQNAKRNPGFICDAEGALPNEKYSYEETAQKWQNMGEVKPLYCSSFSAKHAHPTQTKKFHYHWGLFPCECRNAWYPPTRLTTQRWIISWSVGWALLVLIFIKTRSSSCRHHSLSISALHLVQIWPDGFQISNFGYSDSFA